MTLLPKVVIFLGAAVVAVPVFRRFGLSDVLAYLAAGVIIGPSVLGLVPSLSESNEVLHFAEIGVVFLLFIIGLELHPARLRAFRRLILGLGLAQVLVTAAAIFLVSLLFGLPWPAAVVIGCALSLSSTAFVLQLLGQRDEMMTGQGRAGFAVLLLQDIAVIPMLVLVTALAGDPKDFVGLEALMSLATGAAIVVGFVVAGHYLLRPALKLVASSRVPEAFSAATLLLALGTGLLMQSAGLSMGLGAFLAGVLVADSEYRHKLEADVVPFKRLLLGLFFMAVGMTADLGVLIQSPVLIIGLTVALVLGKALIIYPLGRFFGLTRRAARALAFLLAQGGEFAFVLITVAVTSGLVSTEIAAIITLVVTLSMAITPLAYGMNSRPEAAEDIPFDEINDAPNDIIMVGFGRFGQIIGRILVAQKIPFTALDYDPVQVDLVRRFGNKVYYGDVCSPELLRAAGIGDAKVIVIGMDSPETNLRITEEVASEYPQVEIIARARNRQDALDLRAAGAKVVVRELLHSSLEVAAEVLVRKGLSISEARRVAAVFEEHDQQTLDRQFEIRNDEDAMIAAAQESANELRFLLASDEDTQEEASQDAGRDEPAATAQAT